MKARLFFALSPLALVAICASIQVLAGRLLGTWAWVPTMLGFWLVIGFLLHRYPGTRPRERFRRASGPMFWSVLAILAGLLSLHGFLAHWTLLADAGVVVAWLVFALVNPWFEESYWRGLLIDSTASWGKFASLLYSSLWFAASHPLIWGLAYQRTGSLRWCVAGHMLANLFGLAALVLLNLYDPTIRPGMQ